MQWRGSGILLTVRRHGETSAIIEMFTSEQGRYAGVVRGGAGRRMGPVLQPGAQLDVTWRARLEDHIGSFTVEPLRSRMALVMSDRLMLEGQNAVTSLLSFCLPEREPDPKLYLQSEQLLDLMAHPDVWFLAYLRWELLLLQQMGYGLELSRCAVTGSCENLSYVSPKSGRAVSKDGAGEWADRLLPLPNVLHPQESGSDGEILQGLKVTGHFLENHLAVNLGNHPLPEARNRLLDLFERKQLNEAPKM